MMWTRCAGDDLKRGGSDDTKERQLHVIDKNVKHKGVFHCD